MQARKTELPVYELVQMTGEISEGDLAGSYDNTQVKVGEGVGHEEAPVSDGHDHTHSHETNPSGIVSKLEHCDGLNNFMAEFWNFFNQ